MNRFEKRIYGLQKLPVGTTVEMAKKQSQYHWTNEKSNWEDLLKKMTSASNPAITAPEDREELIELCLQLLKAHYDQFFEWMQQYAKIPLDYTHCSLDQLIELVTQGFVTNDIAAYITKLETEIGLVKADIGVRGYYANSVRSFIYRQYNGELDKIKSSNVISRRAYYLSEFGIVFRQIFSFPFLITDDNLKKFYQELQRACRTYKLPLKAQPGYATDAKDIVKDEFQYPLLKFILDKLDSTQRSPIQCALHRFVSGKDGRIVDDDNAWLEQALITVQAFRFSHFTKPEAPYVSQLWTRLFDLGLTFSSVSNSLFGNCEYKLDELPAYDHPNAIDYAYVLECQTMKKVKFAAPIFVCEACGHFRGQARSGVDKGSLSMPKDISKVAIEMMHLMWYWIGVCKGNPDLLEHIRVYGAFVNRTEIQFCVMLVKKDSNSENMSFVFQAGEEWSFGIGKIATDNALFSHADVGEFSGDFLHDQVISAANDVDDDHQIFESFFEGASAQVKQLKDFSKQKDTNEIMKLLSVLRLFLKDIYTYGHWLSDLIAGKADIGPGQPPADLPREYPKSQSSHGDSSPSKDYETPLKRSAPNGRQAGYQSSTLAAQYTQELGSNVTGETFANDRTSVFGVSPSKNMMKSVIIVKQESSAKEALILQDLFLCKHVVQLFGYRLQADHLLLHEEEMAPTQIHRMTYWDMLPNAVQMVGDILQGLVELKKAGIVHADISPSNVMYSTTTNFYKLVDFNHAFRVNDAGHIQKRKHFYGTKGFQAPEIEAGGIANFSTDVFSLGKVFYWNALEEYIDVAGDAGVFEHPVDDDVFEFCHKMTREDPQDRLSAESLHDELILFWSRHYDEFNCQDLRYSIAAKHRRRAYQSCLRLSS